MKAAITTIALMMVMVCIMSAQENQSANVGAIPSFFLNNQLDAVAGPEEAQHFGNVIFSNASSVYVEVFRMKSKTISFQGEYTDEDLQTENGTFRYYFPNGKVESYGNFLNGFKISVWHRFNLDGTEKSEMYYSEERNELLCQCSMDTDL